MTLDADLVIHNARIATMDVKTPSATAVAVHGDRIAALGTDDDILGRVSAGTQRLDARDRRIVPGIIDSHLHVIRGGLSYNMELRWTACRPLKRRCADCAPR